MPVIASLKKNLPLTVALGTILLSTGLASPYVLSSLRAQSVPTHVVVIGDSIVAGQGDDEKLKGLHGRLHKEGSLHIDTFGLPGATTKGLSMYLEHQLSRNSVLRQKVIQSNVIIIASGLNDFWSESGPKRTANNLRRLIKILHCSSQGLDKAPKKFSIATLAPTTLPAQLSWSVAVNTQINQFPSEEVFVGPRFHEMPKSLLGEDGIHPSPDGYAWLAERTSTFITQLPAASSPINIDCSEKDPLTHGAASHMKGDSPKRKRARRPTQ